MATTTTTTNEIRSDQRFDRSGTVAVFLIVSAVVAAGAILGRPIAAVDFDKLGVVAAHRNEVWLFSLVSGFAIGATYVLAGIATCLLVTARGARLATAGAVLTGLGGLSFAAGFFTLGAASWFASADLPGRAAHFEYLQDNTMRAFGPQMAGFLLSVVGMLLLAWSLWRSHAVPRWLPIAIPVAIVLMIGSGTGRVYDVMHAVFMATLVTLGWSLWRSRHLPRPDVAE
jgi:hypothetical protein